MRRLHILKGDYMQFVTIDKHNIESFIENNTVLIGKMRQSRLKCKQLAVIELLSLLSYCEPNFITNGPLGDVKGCIAVSISKAKNVEEKTIELLSHAGYTYCFYCIDFDNYEISNDSDLHSINPYIWKGKRFSVNKIFEESSQIFRDQAPDKRKFKLLCEDGVIRTIKGYRGNGSEMGRRALPVEDCRLLSNLVIRENTENFIDPFCGGGGIIYQARLRKNIKHLYSIDVAAELAPGLEEYGSIHFIGLASDYKAEIQFDAIATEIPFLKTATEAVCEGFANISKYLSDTCIISIMYSTEQKNDIEECLKKNGYNLCIAFPVNRKGTDVQIAICFRSHYESERMKILWERLRYLS